MQGLYRGKPLDKYYGEWVYGDLVRLHDGRRYIINNIHGACIDEKGNFINTGYPFVCEVDPATVGQNTGLLDKNGKEIYGGDTLRLNNNDLDLVKVCFGEFPVYDINTEEVTDMAVGWYRKVIKTDALSECEPFCYDMPLNESWIELLQIEVVNPELPGVKHAD